MATKNVKDNKSDELNFSDKVNECLLKNRKVIISALGIIAVFFVLLTVFTYLSGQKSKVAFDQLDTIVSEWETAINANDESQLTLVQDDLIARLSTIGEKNKHTFAGVRSNMILAEIYFSKKDWALAQEKYIIAAEKDINAYTAGLCYFNAGTCADELSDFAEAVKWYTKASQTASFTLKPRALFNLGRVEEQMSNKENAIAAYEMLAEQFPSDDWTSLAKSRIIALQLN
ncbi:MAG TPA: tetratricopeptide repeat protein [Treponemataceae bacterium]|nr:tetratricopeptide repeat protein [Treponemataceae bacterium]